MPWYADDPRDVRVKVVYGKLEINEGEMDHKAEDFLRKVSYLSRYLIVIAHRPFADAQKAAFRPFAQRD